MRGTQRQRERDGGAALIEFAFVALLLFTLVFGIIGYAYMMSFRQALTQSAAEGARAGAVAPEADTVTVAEEAANRALIDYDDDGDGIVCGDDHGISCTITVLTPCPGTSAAPRCVQVEVSQPYRSQPLLPSMPGLGLTLPEELSFTSVAETG